MSHPPVEVRWLWRRIVTIGVLLMVFALVGAIIWRTDDGPALKWIGLGLVCFGALAHTVYLTGATVTDWAKLVSAARPGLKIGPASVQSPPEGGQ